MNAGCDVGFHYEHNKPKTGEKVHFMGIYGPSFRIQLATSFSFFQEKIDNPSSSSIFGFVICLFSIFLLWSVKSYDSTTS